MAKAVMQKGKIDVIREMVLKWQSETILILDKGRV